VNYYLHKKSLKTKISRSNELGQPVKTTKSSEPTSLKDQYIYSREYYFKQ